MPYLSLQYIVVQKGEIIRANSHFGVGANSAVILPRLSPAQETAEVPLFCSSFTQPLTKTSRQGKPCNGFDVV